MQSGEFSVDDDIFENTAWFHTASSMPRPTNHQNSRLYSSCSTCRRSSPRILLRRFLAVKRRMWKVFQQAPRYLGLIRTAFCRLGQLEQLPDLHAPTMPVVSRVICCSFGLGRDDCRRTVRHPPDTWSLAEAGSVLLFGTDAGLCNLYDADTRNSRTTELFSFRVFVCGCSAWLRRTRRGNSCRNCCPRDQAELIYPVYT